MTIRIPLRAIAFVLYTLALLAAAFGTSYAVFEWRYDDVNSPAVFEWRDDDVNSRAVLGCWEEALFDFVKTYTELPLCPRGPAGTGPCANDEEYEAARARNHQAYDEYMDRMKDCLP